MVIIGIVKGFTWWEAIIIVIVVSIAGEALANYWSIEALDEKKRRNMHNERVNDSHKLW